MSELLRSGEVIRQSDVGILVLGVLPKLLAGYHHRHGGLGHEIIREGAE